MNKVVNVFSLVILVVFTLMGMTIIMDLSISNFHLKAMPYKVETMSLLAIVVFLLGLLRVRRRWQGVKDMNSFDKFDVVFNISETFIKRERLMTSFEILFMLAALAFFIRLSFLDLNLMVIMIGVLGCTTTLFFLWCHVFTIWVDFHQLKRIKIAIYSIQCIPAPSLNSVDNISLS